MLSEMGWKEEYFKNPFVRIIVIFLSVIGGLLVLFQFYNRLPISSINIIYVLKINIMLTILIIVGIIVLISEEMKKPWSQRKTTI